MDWTFATIYAIHLEADGAGFKTSKEEFVAGAGLPVTDAVIGDDGAFYFTTGGRRGQSALWRVVYTGSESTAPQPGKFAAGDTRSKLAGFIMDPKTADGSVVLENLGSDDRTLRFMARAALERFPDTTWAGHLVKKDDPWTLILGVMAMARLDAKQHRALALQTLDRIDWAALTTHQKLNWLRAAGLVFIRGGEPTEAEKAAVLAKIDSSYPANDQFLNLRVGTVVVLSPGAGCGVENPEADGRGTRAGARAVGGAGRPELRLRRKYQQDDEEPSPIRADSLSLLFACGERSLDERRKAAGVQLVPRTRKPRWWQQLCPGGGHDPGEFI